jgi:formylglycine-generating enzyme required for sulfatase activity
VRRAWLALVAACHVPRGHAPSSHAPLSLAADDRMVLVPAGTYIAGSTPEERAAAYHDYLNTAGQDAAREARWFEREEDRRLARLGAFRIDLLPVTQSQYAEMVAAGAAKPPDIDEPTWRAQGFAQDYATQVVETLKSHGLRVQLDARNEKMQAKIRDAQLQQVPYMGVVGAREAESKTVAVRHRRDGDLGAMAIELFVQRVREETQSRQV